MVGKPWQTSFFPHAEGRKIGTHYTDKTVGREGATEEAKLPLRRITTLKKTLTFNENADLTPRLLQRLIVQEHEELWRMRITKRS